MRRGPVLVVLAGVAVWLLGTVRPAAQPDHPVTFIKVDELKRRLDAGEAATIIDVRSVAEWEELRIKGARSIPLRALPERTAEIPRRGLVVFY
ncbi:MAG TPA: rhodanese-like domain-containing protein [Candidatus Binatia bacterium]|nr:rhodanese-like domain-containing protein [Candidatus Binatia bacterium]